MSKVTLHPRESQTPSEQNGGKTYPAALATQKATRWLALGAVAGPILFTLVWFVLGFVSPGFTLFGTQIAPYSPIGHPISGLGLGPSAPFMNAAFVLGGLLVMSGAVGIFQNMREMGIAARWFCTALLALSGLGLVVDGLFTLEAILPHTAGFLMGTGTPVLSFLVIGLWLRRFPRWHRIGNWLILASPLTLALLVLFFVTFDPATAGEGVGIAGLTQRILVTEVFAWIAVLGWRAFRSSQSFIFCDSM